MTVTARHVADQFDHSGVGGLFLAAGRLFPGEVVMQDLRDAAGRMQRKRAAQPKRKGAAQR